MNAAASYAHAQIYADHHGWLFNWLRGKLGCPANAADLSHDTFLRLLLGAAPGELREPRAFLLVIANRLLINCQRRARVEQDALRQIAVLVRSDDRRGPAETALARDLLAQVVLLLAEELPERPRRAFLMARLEGLSYREIASRLEVSESSVKQYLARALAHCHARLYDDESCAAVR